MKRLSPLVSMLVILVWSAWGLCAETTFEGVYRIRAWSEWNFDKKPGYGPPDYEAQYDGWFDQIFRLRIIHERGEYLKAVVSIDIAEDTWGQQRGFRINDSADGEFIDQAYLELSLPKIGSVRAGKFPVNWGHGLMLSTTYPGVDGVEWSDRWGTFGATLLYQKIGDNVTLGAGDYAYNRDSSMWAAKLSIVPTENHLVELYGGAVDSNYGWPESQFWGYYLGVYEPILQNPSEVSYRFGFMGLSYTGNVADCVDIGLEYGRIFGNAAVNKDHRPTVTGIGQVYPTPAIEGWSLYADVSYYNDLFRVGIAFLIASGQHHMWGPGQLTSINKPSISQNEFKWGNIIGNNDDFLNNVYSGPLYGQPLENITSVKIYGEVTPMKKLTFNAAVIWAKWTDPVGTDPLTTPGSFPGYPHPANYYSNYGQSWRSWSASDDLGWEFDVGASYEIMEGLALSCSAAVLLPGDSWDYVNWDGTRGRWGTIWSVMTDLTYEF
jgi:hypothetical protein